MQSVLCLMYIAVICTNLDTRGRELCLELGPRGLIADWTLRKAHREVRFPTLLTLPYLSGIEHEDGCNHNRRNHRGDGCRNKLGHVPEPARDDDDALSIERKIVNKILYMYLKKIEMREIENHSHT